MYDDVSRLEKQPGVHELPAPDHGPPEPLAGPSPGVPPAAQPGPYKSLAQNGSSLVSRQTGLYRSIGDES